MARFGWSIAFFALLATGGRNFETHAAVLSVDPPALVQRYAFGLLGTHSVRIVLRNDGDEELLFSEDSFVEVILPPDRRIARLQPEVLPLRVPPGSHLTLRWSVPRLAPDPPGARKLPGFLIVRAKYASMDAETARREVSRRVPFGAPPPLFRFARACLVWTVPLASIAWVIARVRRSLRVAHVGSGTPRTRIGRALGAIWRRLSLTLARFPCGLARRMQLVWPSVRSAGDGPDSVLTVLDRCRSVLGTVDPARLPPANVLFHIHWRTAGALDQLARDRECTSGYAQAAAAIAEQYRQAERYAREPDLEALCRALATFYGVVGERFDCLRQRTVRMPPPPALGAATSVSWSTDILWANLDGGREEALSRLRKAPEDVQAIPLMYWAVGSLAEWPPPLVNAVRRLPSANDAGLADAVRTAESCLRSGRIVQGMRALAGVGSAESGERWIESPDMHPALFAMARLRGQFLRLTRILPFSEQKRDQYRTASEGWVRVLERVARTCVDRRDLVGFSRATSLAADHYASLRRYAEALRRCEAVGRVRVAMDGGAFESRATAERIRAEVYADLGSAERAERALVEAGTWFAILGEWEDWYEVAGMRHAIRVAKEEGEPEDTVHDDVVALNGLADSAALALPALGPSLLLREWAVWGEFTLARAKGGGADLILVLASIGRVNREFGWLPLAAILASKVVGTLGPEPGGLSGSGTFLAGTLWDYYLLRARRQHHTTLVLANYYAGKLLSEDYPLRARMRSRKAKQLVETGKLNLAESVRLAMRAEMISEGPQSAKMPARDRSAEALQDGIAAVRALAIECQSAPTDMLRRTSTMRRTSVLTQFIRGLGAASTALDREAFEERAALAYAALQELRVADWNELTDQRLLGDGGDASPQRRRLLRFHHELVAMQAATDGWKAPTGGRRTSEELASAFPQFASCWDGDAIREALKMVATDLDEFLRREMEERSVDSTRLERPPGEIPKIREGVAVVEYIMTGEAAGVFVVTRDAPIQFVGLQPVRLPDLSGMYGKILSAVRRTAAPVERPSDFAVEVEKWETAMRSIATALWPERLREMLRDYGRLCIVPWDSLWNVPFAVLPGIDGQPVVLEKEITLLPGIRLLARESAAPAVTDIGTCIFAYAPDGDNQLNLGREISAMRSEMPRATVVEGIAATAARLRMSLERFQWVHIACHGVTNRSVPMLSRLSLAPSEDVPDGSLYLYQLAQQSPDLHGVFVNACESGVGHAVGDRPDTLAAGFMAAGARAVVGTLGAVCDDVAVALAGEFYKALKSARPGLALCLGLRRLASLDPSVSVEGSTIPMRHPLAWWPYVCISRD